MKPWNEIVNDCNADPNSAANLKCIPAVFQNIVTAALVLAGVVAVYLIIFSAFKFILGGQDPKQVEGARNTLTYAIIGLVVILFSFFIINFFAGVTNVTCLMSFGFTNCQ